MSRALSGAGGLLNKPPVHKVNPLSSGAVGNDPDMPYMEEGEEEGGGGGLGGFDLMQLAG